MNICKKCGEAFSTPPATSRVDNSPICPLCGHREALDVAVKNGAMTKEEADEIIKLLSRGGVNNK